jgi:hypothetical protein
VLRIGLAMMCLLAGCGVQALGAAHARDAGNVPMSLNLGGRFVGTRSSGAFTGADVVLGVPNDGAFGVRHGIATVGYRWLGHPFALELGADLGAGQPAMHGWGGTGLYVGASSTLLARISGRQDTDIGYAPGALLWDLALGARGGVWSRAEDDTRRELGDAALLLGVRGSVVSDIVVSDNKNWKP